MRTIFVFCLIVFGNLSFSQESAKIDRVWVGFNHGLNHYNEITGHVQLFKHLSCGAAFQLFRAPHGPTYSESTSFITSKTYQLKDAQNDVSLFVGFTTEAPHKSFLSVGIGPSFGKSYVFTNIEVKKDPWTENRYFDFDFEEYRKVGFAYRAEFNISVAQVVGLNFGVVGNFNKTQTYHRFIFGLNFGLLSSGEKANA